MKKIYRQYLKMIGWSLVKGSIDYKLYDENGAFICSIKIAHGKKSKQKVVAHSVHKTEVEFKKRGWPWPPQKKLKNS
ncbi:hypothetical protein [Candidatus Protochlamydia phocaeensis]|uniref:hypothetical protein n=1 Tax=Candidatus Protochlamydia phocaeensis TaxID=1414722 RepID=UPI0008399344|nr:hypothetical protein [Candidatus Protochlamydia phocaeensis]